MRWPGGLLRSFLRTRNGTKLLQQAEGVDLRPMFDHSAVNDAMDGDALHLHLFARGGNPEELPGVLAVARQPGDDPVAIGVLVFDLVAELGEGVQRVCEALAGTFDASGKRNWAPLSVF